MPAHSIDFHRQNRAGSTEEVEHAGPTQEVEASPFDVHSYVQVLCGVSVPRL